MDLSKLPKLSNTPAPPPQQAHEAPVHPSPRATANAGAVAYCGACGQPVRYGARFCDACGQPLMASTTGDPGAPVTEAFISIIAGLFLLFISARFLQWILHITFGAEWTWQFTDTDGSPIPYSRSDFFWTDLGPFAFAIVLILNGIVLLTLRKRAMLWVMLVLTVAVALYNLIYLVMTFNRGFAAISFLAAAFGAMMAFYHWRLLQMLPRPHPHG